MIPVSEAIELLRPRPTVIPLRLIAYHAIRLQGCHVDMARNLADCVTVEQPARIATMLITAIGPSKSKPACRSG